MMISMRIFHISKIKHSEKVSTFFAPTDTDDALVVPSSALGLALCKKLTNLSYTAKLLEQYISLVTYLIDQEHIVLNFYKKEVEDIPLYKNIRPDFEHIRKLK